MAWVWFGERFIYHGLRSFFGQADKAALAAEFEIQSIGADSP
jgi:hypothetical protein